MKVLVVDDSRVARMIIKSVILDQHPDWQIDEAASADEAQTKAAADAYDIISIDINMPGRDGFALIEALRADGVRARMALFSANVQDAVRQRASDTGVAFIAKPVSPVSVNALLAAVL
jgi:two-component system, chemotaxis family, chemotaxis protein CheY